MFHHVCESKQTLESRRGHSSNSQLCKLNEGFSFVCLYLEVLIIVLGGFKKDLQGHENPF